MEIVTGDQFIDQIAALAMQYKKRFGKSLGVTAEIGEYKTAQLLNLELAKGGINRGFDATDKQDNKVQIKTRIASKTTQRTGLFNNFEFDYALLVLMSESYEIKEVYKASRSTIKRAINTQAYKRPSLPIRKFKSIGEQTYPLLQ